MRRGANDVAGGIGTGRVLENDVALLVLVVTER